MVDFRPFRALRYTTRRPLSDVISPPYDVLSAAAIEELKGRDAHNVIRLEHPTAALSESPDPYAAAAALLDEWVNDGVLRRDEAPAFYLDEQGFREDGKPRKRNVLYGRLRLQPWDEGAVLPHEYTMSGPKEDRLRLLQALRANTSPIYLLYDDRDGEIAALLAGALNAPVVGHATNGGDSHGLRAIEKEALRGALQERFLGRRLYIADGHHRYETALWYRDLRRQGGVESPGADYVLVGLTAGNDPGLSLHATHRLLAEAPVWDMTEQLERDFEVRPIDRPTLDTALAGPDAAFAIAGLEAPKSLHLLIPHDLGGLAGRVGGDGPNAWRRLDVNIVQHVILGAYLAMDPLDANQPGLSYVHSTDEALDAVTSGEAALAFLLRPLLTADLFAVSDAGARLPQKTTYFYPKLPTGVVINPLD